MYDTVMINAIQPHEHLHNTFHMLNAAAADDDDDDDDRQGV